MISYTLNHLKLWVLFWSSESWRGWPNSLYILVCHSVTSCQISGYHTGIWRGYLGLSYDPITLQLIRKPAIHDMILLFSGSPLVFFISQWQQASQFQWGGLSTSLGYMISLISEDRWRLWLLVLNLSWDFLLPCCLFWAGPKHSSPIHTIVDAARNTARINNGLSICANVIGPHSGLSRTSTS